MSTNCDKHCIQPIDLTSDGLAQAILFYRLAMSVYLSIYPSVRLSTVYSLSKISAMKKGYKLETTLKVTSYEIY